MGTGPASIGRLRERLAPTVVKLDEQQLDALRAQYADEVRTKLAQGSDKHLEELVQQANETYLEQNRRAERAEQRASTIVTAASVLLGLVVTVGVLRFSTSGAGGPVFGRAVTSVAVVLVLIPFILASRYALEVTSAQHGWSRPDSWRLVLSRAGLDQDFHVQTLAALGAAAEYNAATGDWKFKRLDLARRMFRLGMLLVLVYPVARLALRLAGFGD